MLTDYYIYLVGTLQNMPIARKRSKKRRVWLSTREMLAIADIMHLERGTKRSAVGLLKRVFETGENILAGRSYVVFELASLYLAARGTMDERPIAEFIDAARVKMNAHLSVSVREMNRVISLERNLLGIDITASKSATEYVPMILDRVGLGDTVRDRAVELIELYGDAPAIRKRYPKAVAAGAIYAAGGGKVTQPVLSVKAGVSTTTLREIAQIFRRKSSKKRVKFTTRRVGGASE